MQTPLWSVVLLLLTIGAFWLGRTTTGQHGAKARWTKAALALVAATCFTRYTYLPPFGEWNVRPSNVHDFTHYYLGAKYFDELGYERLYACVSEAVGAPDRAPVRDLSTKQMSTAAQVRETTPCRPHFSQERWSAFRADVFALGGMLVSRNYYRFLQDHGFNPSPTWLLLAKPIASAVPVSLPAVMALGSLDVGLLLLTVLVVAWSFGAVPAALATVVLTTLPAAESGWTIGSYLRWDWLLPLALVPVLLRRAHFAAAGGALAAAVALRIFPVIGALFIGAFLVVQRLRGQTVDHAWRRFWLGFVAAGVVILAATAAVAGIGGITSFVDNILRHAAKASLNEMGLRTALSYVAAVLAGNTNDFAIVANKAAAFVWILPINLAVAVGALWVATRPQSPEPIPAWTIACLGLLFIPLGWLEISSYYYMFWFAVALLAAWRHWIGAALLAANLVMQLAVVATGTKTLASFAVQSALVCTLVAFIALTLHLRPRWTMPEAGEVQEEAAGRSTGG